MSVDACSACLQRLASASRWSEASSGACLYEFNALGDDGPLLASLVRHLASRNVYQERFPLGLSALTPDWRPLAEALISGWVFGQRDVLPTEAALVRQLMQHIADTVPEALAFEVVGEGTMLPDVVWNAIVFSGASGNWLLEFGWSD